MIWGQFHLFLNPKICNIPKVFNLYTLPIRHGLCPTCDATFRNPKPVSRNSERVSSSQARFAGSGCFIQSSPSSFSRRCMQQVGIFFGFLDDGLHGINE